MGKTLAFEKTCKMLAMMNIGFLLLLLCCHFMDGFAANSGLHPVFYDVSFFSESDRFADFFNPVQYSMDRNLVNDVDTDSPPFLHLCGWLVSIFIQLFFPGKLQNRFGGAHDFSQTIYGTVVWSIILIAYMVLFFIGLKKLFIDKGEHLKQKFVNTILITTSVFAAYPFLWAIDRGNFVLFVALLLLYATAELEDKPEKAAVLIGLAAAMKIYPAIFGLLFIKKKDWKSAIICATTGIGATLIALFVFSTNGQGVGFMETLTDWIHKLTSYTVSGNGQAAELIIWNNSFLTPRYFYAQVLMGVQNIESINVLLYKYKMLVCFISAAALAGCFFLKKRHDIILILSVLMVGFPTYSATYNLILLIVPILYWISKEEDKIIPIIIVLLLMNKAIVVYYVENLNANITLNSLLNPLLLFFIIGYIYCKRIILNSKVLNYIKLLRK